MSAAEKTRVEPAAAEGPAATWRGRVGVWVRRALLVAMVAFAGVAVARNWPGVVTALRQMSPLALFGAGAAGVAAVLASLLVWRSLLTDLGSRLTLRQAARVFFLAQLGKYIPGSVWSMLAQAELGSQLHVPRRSSVTVGALSLVVAVAVGLPLAAVTLALAHPATARQYWFALLVVPPILALLHPAVLGRCLNLLLRLVRRPPLPRAPSWGGLLRAAGWQLVVWSLFGVHVWLLLSGVGAPGWRSLAVATGGYALAFSLGLLAVGLPAGAGVRDGVLIVVLTAVVAAPAALVVALISRTLLLLTDILLAGTQHLVWLWRPAHRPPG